MFRRIASELRRHVLFTTLGIISGIIILALIFFSNIPRQIFLLASLALLADVGSGLFSLLPRFRGISTRYVIAFSAGIVISVALFELLPKANSEDNWALLGAGFFIMYLIDKGLALHQCGESECEVTGMSWVAILGMSADNLLDGVALAVTYLTEPRLGIVVTLAIIAHEIPQFITSTLIMKEQGYRLTRIIVILLVAGLVFPLGAGLGQFIPTAAHQAAIAFVAGVFIYTGATALMTEAHHRFNWLVMLFLLLGSLIALGLKFVE
jgi:zinc and cadmium transporter